jgi:hypothetical protein
VNIHIGEPLKGNCKQADSTALISLMKEHIPEKLEGFMDLKGPLKLHRMYEKYGCPPGH